MRRLEFIGGDAQAGRQRYSRRDACSTMTQILLAAEVFFLLALHIHSVA